MRLTRLLILPALAALLALAVAVPATRASAQVTCPCWPDGVPLVEPTLSYSSPLSGGTSWVYIARPPTFLQTVQGAGYCRVNGTFRRGNAAELQACTESLQCLGQVENPGDEICDDGFDNDCDGHPDETDPDCVQLPPCVCDRNSRTGQPEGLFSDTLAVMCTNGQPTPAATVGDNEFLGVDLAINGLVRRNTANGRNNLAAVSNDESLEAFALDQRPMASVLSCGASGNGPSVFLSGITQQEVDDCAQVIRTTCGYESP